MSETDVKLGICPEPYPRSHAAEQNCVQYTNITPAWPCLPYMAPLFKKWTERASAGEATVTQRDPAPIKHSDPIVAQPHSPGHLLSNQTLLLLLGSRWGQQTPDRQRGSHHFPLHRPPQCLARRLLHSAEKKRGQIEAAIRYRFGIMEESCGDVFGQLFSNSPVRLLCLLSLI